MACDGGGSGGVMSEDSEGTCTQGEDKTLLVGKCWGVERHVLRLGLRGPWKRKRDG